MKSLSILSVSVCCLLSNLVFDNNFVSKVSDVLVTNEKPKVESHIEYDGFLDLCKEVKDHREERLVNWETFLEFADDPNTMILDTRSREKFELSHIKGAVNLPFTEFTVSELFNLTGYDNEKRILIYCNNNFIGDRVAYELKGNPIKIATNRKSNSKRKSKSRKSRSTEKTNSRIGLGSYFNHLPDDISKDKLLNNYKSLVGSGPSLALNLPTYITLYGYGYQNVYELADLLHVRDDKVSQHLEANNFFYIDGVKVNAIR